MIKSRQQGFTLIEVIVGVAILMVAMTGMFAIYSWCTVEVRRARHRTLVTLCAQQMMEMIVSTPQNVGAYHGFSTTSLPSASSPVSHDLHTWQTCIKSLPMPATGTIAVSDDPEIPYAILVRVTILYENYGRSNTMVLSQKFPTRHP